MEAYAIQIVLGIIGSAFFAMLWKTNGLLSKIIVKEDQTQALMQQHQKLMDEAVKALRHNESEHMQIVHVLENMKKDIITEVRQNK